MQIEDDDFEKMATNINESTPFPERELKPGLIIKRIGKCEPEKCKSACCRFHLTIINNQVPQYDYLSFFADRIDKQGNLIYDKVCKNFDVLQNKCMLWGTNKFPKVCKQFPSINDYVYRNVMDKCTFKFIVDKEDDDEK